jgi:hypothetical protein
MTTIAHSLDARARTTTGFVSSTLTITAARRSATCGRRS